MNSISSYVSRILEDNPLKMILSKPVSKNEPYKKIIMENKGDYYQLSKYTEKQVFHENIPFSILMNRCIDLLENTYQQLNAWSKTQEFSISISKKKKVLFHAKQMKSSWELPWEPSHNRKKQYLLCEGEVITPLVDMGIFTANGAIVKSMYDKYKQINRFIELIDDIIKKQDYKHLNIIDFGCGKSYLTFIVYHYLTVIRSISVTMIGLDLKEDVIKKCNACDTATDYALYNAISWNASMIFSVPCCQHELNQQISTDTFSLFTRYGIVSERFSALMTDAIRGNLLEYCGYHTQLLEFIDFEHTPKNILIRAVKNPNKSKAARQKALDEVKKVISEYHITPTLYQLLGSRQISEHELPTT